MEVRFFPASLLLLPLFLVSDPASFFLPSFVAKGENLSGLPVSPGVMALGVLVFMVVSPSRGGNSSRLLVSMDAVPRLGAPPSVVLLVVSCPPPVAKKVEILSTPLIAAAAFMRLEFLFSGCFFLSFLGGMVLVSAGVDGVFTVSCLFFVLVLFVSLVSNFPDFSVAMVAPLRGNWWLQDTQY